MGSLSTLTHPLASHVLLLSQLYHSPSLRWEAMQFSLCLLASSTFPLALTLPSLIQKQKNMFETLLFSCYAS